MGWRSVGRMPYAPTVLPEKHAAFRTFHAQGGAKPRRRTGLLLSGMGRSCSWRHIIMISVSLHT